MPGRTTARSRVCGFALVVVFVGAACTSASTPDETATTSGTVPPEVLHEQIEDFLAECMLAEGFDYLRRPFVPRSNFIEESLFIPAAAERGYGGAVGRLQLAIDPPSLGLPVSPDESHELKLEYWAALFGEEFVVRGDEDAGWSGALPPPPGGCMGRADQTFAENRRAADPFPETPLLDVRRRLLASPVYAEFAEAWRRCMRDASVPHAAPDPISHTEAERGRHHAAVALRLNELALDPETASIVFDDIKGRTVLDPGWLDEVTALDPELDRIVTEEVETATADHACRSAHRQLVDEEYERLLQAAVTGE